MGNFVLLEVLPTSGEMSPVFTLQGRMEPSIRWPGATTHHGLAFGRPDLAFHVRVCLNIKFMCKHFWSQHKVTL